MFLIDQSQEEIVTANDMPRKTVADSIDNFGDISKRAMITDRLTTLEIGTNQHVEKSTPTPAHY